MTRARARLAVILLACPLLTGCGGGLLGELWGLRLQDLIGAVLGYGIAGLVAGGVLGLVAFFALRAWGKLQGEWRGASVARFLAGALVLIGCGLCGAGVGACIGVVRGSDSVLRNSQLGTKVFPEAASALADLTFHLVKVAERRKAGDQDVSFREAELETFRSGKDQLQVAAVRGLGEALSGGVSDELVGSVSNKVLGEVPEDEKGVTRRLMEGCTKELIHLLVTHEVGGATKGKLARGALDFDAAAARQAPPATLCHAELKDHYVNKLLVPFCLQWVEKSVSLYKLGFALGLVLVPLLPLPIFWGLGRLFGGKAPAEKEPGAPPPAASQDGAAAA
ncbi:MAG: hypothetical protein AB7N76_11090 [Planctomycetota bacterium]